MEHQCQLSGIGGVSEHIPTHSTEHTCLQCAALDPLHTEQIIIVIVLGLGLGPIQVPMSMVMMTHQ